MSQAVMGIGLFTSTFIILRAVFKFLEEVKPGERIKEIYYQYDRMIRKSPRIMGFNLSMPYILSAIALASCGVMFGLMWLNNTLAAIFLMIFGLAFPQLIMLQVVAHRRDKIIEQLGMAVRLFAAEYNDTAHTIRAIGNAGERLPEPIGSIFRRAEKEFLVGDDTRDIINRMAHRIGTEYGRMFGHLLITSLKDEAVKPLFSGFALRLTSHQELLRRNRQEITIDRISIGILNGCIVPAFWVMQKIIPESYQFFTTISYGKGIVVFCLLSTTVGILLDLFATRSAVYD